MITTSKTKWNVIEPVLGEDFHSTGDKFLKFEDWEEFTGRMKSRLEKGHINYGNNWFYTNLINEIEEEVIDGANYFYLLYRKLKLYKEALKKV